MNLTLTVCEAEGRFISSKEYKYVRSKGKTSESKFHSILTLFGAGRQDQGQPTVLGWLNTKINIISSSREFCLNHATSAQKGPSTAALSLFSLGGSASCFCQSFTAALGTHTHAPFLLISELRRWVKHLLTPCSSVRCLTLRRVSGQHGSPSFPTHIAEVVGSNLSGGSHPHLNRPELSLSLFYMCVTSHLRGKLRLSHNLSFLKLLGGKIVWA